VRADYREDGSGVAGILAREYNFRVTRESLKAGDYIINDCIAVERKTALDFAQSIIDERLFRQAARMKREFDSALFVVEGGSIYDTAIDIHPRALKGALVSLSLIWNIPTLFSSDAADTALLIWLAVNQEMRSASCLQPFRPGRKPKRLQRRKLFLLQGLPNVGPKLALQLLAHFGSIEKVVTASEEELTNVPGIGKRKSGIIRRLITSVQNSG